MNEETFNLDTRKFLKQFGVKAQRQIELIVEEAVRSGQLKGTETLRARAVLTLGGFEPELVVEEEIRLE